MVECVGKFDVSLLSIDSSVFEVSLFTWVVRISTEDQRNMDHFMKYKKKTGKDIHKDNRAVEKLRREVEKAKP